MPPASTSLVHPPIPEFPRKWRTVTESKKSKNSGAASQLATNAAQEGICARETLKGVKILY